MYQYPYGDSQQLNLDWIINKLIELEQSFVAGESAELEQFANALISLTYIPTQAYNNSDIVFHDGHLYRCNTTIPAPGEVWDPAHWDQIMLGNTVANLVRAVAGMNSDHVFNESNVPGTHVTEAFNALVEDIRYDNHKIQQKKDGAYTDVIPVEDTPSNNSDRLVSSKAAYDLKGAITQTLSNFAKVETGTTASQNYIVGDFVVVDGQLYKVISQISATDTFIVNTNIKVANVCEELSYSTTNRVNLANRTSEMTFDSGLSLHITDNIVLKIGRICMLTFGIKITNAQSLSALGITNYLPQAFRPLSNCIACSDTGIGDGKMQSVNIYNNGTIRLYPVNLNMTTYAMGTITYLSES